MLTIDSNNVELYNKVQIQEVLNPVLNNKLDRVELLSKATTIGNDSVLKKVNDRYVRSLHLRNDTFDLRHLCNDSSVAELLLENATIRSIDKLCDLKKLGFVGIVSNSVVFDGRIDDVIPTLRERGVWVEFFSPKTGLGDDEDRFVTKFIIKKGPGIGVRSILLRHKNLEEVVINDYEGGWPFLINEIAKTKVFHLTIQGNIPHPELLHNLTTLRHLTLKGQSVPLPTEIKRLASKGVVLEVIED